MPKASDIKTQSGNGALFATQQPTSSSEQTESGQSNNAAHTIIGDNLGDGVGVFAGSNQGAKFTTLEFRSLEAGPGIRINGDSNSIVIESTGVLTTNLSDMNGILPTIKGGTGLNAIPFNALLIGNGTNNVATIEPPSEPNLVLQWTGTQYKWVAMATQSNTSGTVKSVSVNSSNNMISFTGSPIVESGTITATILEQNIPINNLNGVLGTSKGGTGLTVVAPNSLLVGNGTGSLLTTPAPNSSGQVLTWMGTTFAWMTQDVGVKSISVLGNSGVSASASTTAGVATINLALTQTGVASGTYANPTLSVDSFGRITSITSSQSESVDGQNLGSVGQPIFAGKSGSVLTFKQVEADVGVSATSTSTSVKVGLTTVPMNKGGTGSSTLTPGTIAYVGSDRFYSITAPGAGSTSILGYDGASYRWYNMPATSSVASATDDLTVTSSSSGSSISYTIKFNPESVSINEFGSILEPHKGGTGRSSLPINSIILGNGANSMNYVSLPTTAGTYLSWNGAGYEWKAVATSGGGISSITAGIGLTTTANSTAGGGVITTSGTLHMANTGVTAGTYKLLSASVSATGQITSATDVEEMILDRSNHKGTMPAEYLSGTVSPSNGGTGLNAAVLAGKAGQSLVVNPNENGYTFVQQMEYKLPMASTNTLGGVKVGTTMEISSDGTLDVGRVDYSKLVNAPELFSGFYSDLVGKPTLFSGAYADLTGAPVLSAVATTGNYSDLTGAPVLSAVATTGSYSDLSNRPNISVVGLSGRYSDLVDAPDLNRVATSQSLGMVKVGAGLSITADGTLSATATGEGGDPSGLTSVGLVSTNPALVVTNSPLVANGDLSIGFDVDALGLSPIAKSSSYYDLIDAPDISGFATREFVTQEVTRVIGELPPPVAEIDAGVVRNMISVAGDLVYSPETGVISYTTPVGFSGSYNDLTDKPVIPSIAGLATEVWVNQQIASASIEGGGGGFSGNYDDLAGKPTLFSGDYNDLTNKPVLFSGSYNDLTNKPVIPSIVGLASETWVSQQISANTFSGSYSDLTNRPALFSGSYNDLTEKPVIPTQYTDAMARLAISVTGDLSYDSITGVISYTGGGSSFSGDYNDLTNKPVLFSGSYNDLTNKPVIPSIVGLASETWVNDKLAALPSGGFSGSYNDLTDKPTIPTQYTDSMARLAISVAGDLSYNNVTGVISYTGGGSSFSGDYNDLTNKPVLFSGNYNDLINQPVIPSIAGLASETWVTEQLAGLPTGGFSGSYNDLTDKPVIPSVDGLATEAWVTSQISAIPASFSGSYNDLTDKPAIPTQYTDAMARASVSLVAGTSGITYDQASGVIDASSLVIPKVESVGAGNSLVTAQGIKSIVAGSNITITEQSDTLTISSTASGGGGGGASVNVQSNGTLVATAPSAINFTGSGVTVTESGGVANVEISAAQELGIGDNAEYIVIAYNAGTGGGMTMTDAIKEVSPGIVEAKVVDPAASKVSLRIRGRSRAPSSIWVYGYNANTLFWTPQPYSGAVGSLTLRTEDATGANDSFPSGTADRIIDMAIPYLSSQAVGKPMTRTRTMVVFGY